MVKIDKNLFYVFIAVGATILIVFLLLFLSTIKGDKGTLEGKTETAVNQPVVKPMKASQETNKDSSEPKMEYNATTSSDEFLVQTIERFMPIMMLLLVGSSILSVFINSGKRKRGKH